MRVGVLMPNSHSSSIKVWRRVSLKGSGCLCVGYREIVGQREHGGRPECWVKAHANAPPLFCSTSFALQILCDARRRISIPTPSHSSTSFYPSHPFICIPSFTFSLLLQWFPKFQFSHASFSATYLLKSFNYFFSKGLTYSSSSAPRSFTYPKRI